MFTYETMIRPAQELVLPVDDRVLGILGSSDRSSDMKFRNPIAAVLEQ